jgi:hypothetical protein
MTRNKKPEGLTVYHGSSTRGIIDLDANQPPEGGIGYGVYVTDDIEVARFYGKVIYEFRLRLNENDILFVGSTFENHDPVFGQEGHSVLVGEHVEPFGFWIGKNRYTVGFEDSTEDAARTAIILEALYDRQAVFPEPIEGALQSYIKQQERSGDSVSLEDFVESDMEDLVDWDEMNRLYPDMDFIECDEDLQKVKDAVWKVFEPIQEKADKIVKRSLGLVIDLMDIGAEARFHGYRAVKMDGVRGGFPDTEILVFDPNDLEMIGEVEE